MFYLNLIRNKCYSVRLKSLTQISDKCYKVVAFDGSEAMIPVSQIFGIDYEVNKSDSYWISSWILDQKKLQFSRKKIGWYDPEAGQVLPNLTIEHHIPNKKEVKQNDPDANLIR